MAQKEWTFTGCVAPEIFAGPSSLSPGPVTIPWLWWELFAALDDERFLSIAEAGAYLILASILQDHLIDGQVSHIGPTAVLRDVFRRHGTSVLRQATPANTSFWAQFDRLRKDHRAGLAAELRARLDPKTFDYQRCLTIAQGKVAPVVIPVVAMLTVTEKSDRLAPMEKSMRLAGLAKQILDDVLDWQEDLAARRLTYFLAQLLPPDSWRAEIWPLPGEVLAFIESEWADVKHFREGRRLIGQAIEEVGHLDSRSWGDYLADLDHRAEQRQKQMAARHLLRGLIPVVTSKAIDVRNQ